MSPAHRTLLGNFSWVFIVFVANVQNCTCIKTCTSWVKAVGTPDIICPNDTMRATQVSTVTKCGHLCTKVTGCTSFTYIDTIDQTNCYMMNVSPASVNCYSDSSATHFLKLVTPITCQPNDGIYSTHLLPDCSYISYRIVTVAADAATARAVCSQSGGSLIKLSTVMKLRFMQDVFSACPEFGETFYYIDGSNDYTDAVWRWKDGETINMNSTFWSDNRPDNPTTQHCVVVDSRYNWRLNDAPCSSLYPYICEKV